MRQITLTSSTYGKLVVYCYFIYNSLHKLVMKGHCDPSIPSEKDSAWAETWGHETISHLFHRSFCLVSSLKKLSFFHFVRLIFISTSINVAQAQNFIDFKTCWDVNWQIMCGLSWVFKDVVTTVLIYSMDCVKCVIKILKAYSEEN